jgi:cellulose synthase/poly-beta-1,6-N-acetylglucosamine synthase-like glycosyltransferase
MSAFDGVAIGIPARNEEADVERALDSVLEAATGVGRVAVVLAADHCDDDTAAIARCRFRRLPANVRAEVIDLEAACVGIAREQACRAAATLLTSWVGARSCTWIATTDADSAVPPGWLASQRQWALDGADAVTGLVRVSSNEALAPRARAFLAAERRLVSRGHDHVYGANLGIRAEWWRRVGGFPPISAGEDRQIIHTLRAAGARVVSVVDPVVLTSGRLTPRAPDGFGSQLAKLSGMHPPWGVVGVERASSCPGVGRPNLTRRW